MPEYISRPVKIHAIQWNGQNTAEVGEFIHRHGGNVNTARFYVDKARIHTDTGDAWLDMHAYLICGTHGEFYPCPKAVFEYKYILEKSE